MAVQMWRRARVSVGQDWAPAAQPAPSERAKDREPQPCSVLPDLWALQQDGTVRRSSR